MSNEVTENGVSRRTVLKGAALGGIGLVGGGTLLTSCGSDEASGPVTFTARTNDETGLKIAQALADAYTAETGNEVTMQGSGDTNAFQDGIRHGGIASSISEMFREAGLNVALHSIGVPLAFIEHSKRAEILEDLGITAQKISRDIVEWSSTVEEMQFPAHENADHKQTR